ncbi:hypothetical protein ACOSQ4_018359 [Xanthoceras sorbifolium]
MTLGMVGKSYSANMQALRMIILRRLEILLDLGLLIWAIIRIHICGVPGFSEGVLLGSAAGGEEAKSMVGEPTIGSFLVGSLAVPSGLSFGVRRRVGPTGIKSLGVLGAGKWVLDAAGCDGGLWVGEGRVLVPAARSVVPDLNSDRVAAAVLLGLSGFSGGLNSGVNGVLEPTLGSDLVSFNRGPGVAVGCFLVSSVVVSRGLRVGERRVVEPAAGNSLYGTRFGRAGGGGGESAFSTDGCGFC